MVKRARLRPILSDLNDAISSQDWNRVRAAFDELNVVCGPVPSIKLEAIRKPSKAPA